MKGNARLPTDELLALSTLRISTDTGGGTGFSHKFEVASGDSAREIPALVTNRHVLEGATHATFEMHVRDENGGWARGKREQVTIADVRNVTVFHPDPDVDLCAIPSRPIAKRAQGQGVSPMFVGTVDSDIPTEEDLASLTMLEKTVMVGYPLGLGDSHNNLPIVRQGTTATHPKWDFNGRAEFLLDIAAYPGSSGSPVYLYDGGPYGTRDGQLVLSEGRLFLLGVLFATYSLTASSTEARQPVPISDDEPQEGGTPINLGIVIKAQMLKDLGDELASRFPGQSQMQTQ